MKKITKYQNLAQHISQILEQGRKGAVSSLNTILLQTYWEIGKAIVEFEQEGKVKAEYGKELLILLSKELKKYGKGFSRTNLQYMRIFYLYFPKTPDASGKLTWSHYVEILGVSNHLAWVYNDLRGHTLTPMKKNKTNKLYYKI